MIQKSITRFRANIG